MNETKTYDRLSLPEVAEMLSAKRLWASQQELDLRRTLETVALLEARLMELRDDAEAF